MHCLNDWVDNSLWIQFMHSVWLVRFSNECNDCELNDFVLLISDGIVATLIRLRMVQASWSFSSSLKPTISCLWLSFAVKNPLIRVIVKCVSENFLSLISIRPRLILSQPLLLPAFILMLVQEPCSMRTFNSSKGRKSERVEENRVIKEEWGNETQRMNEIK